MTQPLCLSASSRRSFRVGETKELKLVTVVRRRRSSCGRGWASNGRSELLQRPRRSEMERRTSPSNTRFTAPTFSRRFYTGSGFNSQSPSPQRSGISSEKRSFVVFCCLVTSRSQGKRRRSRFLFPVSLERGGTERERERRKGESQRESRGDSDIAEGAVVVEGQRAATRCYYC